ncbi:MAG: hypothetical protein FWF46_02385 [Oscillospiraceae bacterium]|nr:hypothetical protein [Oscillospiraceae bacterium]
MKKKSILFNLIIPFIIIMLLVLPNHVTALEDVINIDTRSNRSKTR